MKPLKMFGLAALVALMAMAFVGASSAMAGETALCPSEAEGCKAIGHVHEESVGKAKLLSSVEVECNVLYLGDTVEKSVKPLEIKGTFTYTNCGSCEVEEENGPSTIKVLRTGHETAEVTGEGLVSVNCFGFIECAFNGTGLLGTAKGPLLSTQKNGEVTITGKTTNKEAGGFLCPKTSQLDITTTPLSPTYIVEPLALHTAYCVDVAGNTGEYSDRLCNNLTPVPKTGLYQIEPL